MVRHSIGTIFRANAKVTCLKELKYFGMTLWGSDSFRDCNNLSIVEFPATLRSIEYFPLNYRRAMITLVFHSTRVPTYTGNKTSYFFGAYTFGTCYAPDESLDAYREYYPKYTFYPLSEYDG